MGRVLYMLLILVALSPVATHAEITSTTEAEADTGGNTAEQGGTVETGSSGSQVKTTNVLGSEGGTVDIEIRTETNGEVRTESIKKQVPGGVEVNVTASSSGSVKTSVSKSEARGKVTMIVSGNATSVATLSTSFWTRIPLLSWFWRAGSESMSLDTESEVEGEGVVEGSVDEEEPSSPAGFQAFFRKLFSFLPFF